MVELLLRKIAFEALILVKVVGSRRKRGNFLAGTERSGVSPNGE